MTRTELVNLLQRLGVNPSRRLGQNFLIDSNLLDAMLRDLLEGAARQRGVL